MLFFLKFNKLHAQENELFNTSHDEVRFLYGFSLNIQANRLSIGYINGANLNPDPNLPNNLILSEIYPSIKYALSAGAMCSYKIHKNIYIRSNPQVFISSDKSFYYTTNNKITKLHNLPSTVFNLPFHIKFVSNRDVNFQGYFFLGPKIEFDLSAGSLERKNVDFVQLKPINLGYEAGVGVTFYFPLVNISTELKFSNGFSNLIKQNALPLSQSINNIQTNIISFGFIFED